MQNIVISGNAIAYKTCQSDLENYIKLANQTNLEKLLVLKEARFLVLSVFKLDYIPLSVELCFFVQ